MRRKNKVVDCEILTAIDFIAVVRTILIRVADVRRKQALSSWLANPIRTSRIRTSCKITYTAQNQYSIRNTVQMFLQLTTTINTNKCKKNLTV